MTKADPSEKKQAEIAKRIWSSAPRGRPIPATVRRALAEVGLGAFEQDVASLSRRVMVLEPQEGRSVPVGVARLGGAPDLPLKEGWPEVEGELLSFILQVPVEDTLLALFAGGTEHQVVAINPRSLQRRPVPTAAKWRDPHLGLLQPVPLEVKEGWALPPPGSDGFIALVSRHPALGEQRAAYQAAVDALVPPADSHLFGFARQPSLEAGRKKELPLLSVTSSARAGLAFPDAGSLEVSWATGARLGRGVVKGTTAVLVSPTDP
ncbi:MAG: YwqG family protein [Myxococcota bacterium]|nr:YwqG family protein [Myxococcota bacterium]